MLNQIYELLPDDVTDFNNLNALPSHSKGPQVPPMSYKNANPNSSVIVDLTGLPLTQIPNNFLFSDVLNTNTWIVMGELVIVDGELIIQSGISFDSNGDARNLYAQCATPGQISAVALSLTSIVVPVSNVFTITNPKDAVVSGSLYPQCVDKKTIDDPTYQEWADAMEANQPISTRDVITIMQNG